MPVLLPCSERVCQAELDLAPGSWLLRSEEGDRYWVEPTAVANSGTVTLPGLCSNTDYGLRVTVTDAATGASQVYDWLRGGARVDVLTGLTFNLVGRTRARPVPPEFLVAWSVSVAEPTGSTSPTGVGTGAVEGTLAALSVRVGEHTLVSFYDNGIKYHQCNIKWDLIVGANEVEFTWQRVGGIWQTPSTSNGNTVCSAFP